MSELLGIGNEKFQRDENKLQNYLHKDASVSIITYNNSDSTVDE